MIPRALPKLMTDAVRNGWDVHVEHWLYSVQARFARGSVLVELAWSSDSLHLTSSQIDGFPTQYTQCTRLLRTNPEGATS